MLTKKTTNSETGTELFGRIKEAMPTIESAVLNLQHECKVLAVEAKKSK